MTAFENGVLLVKMITQNQKNNIVISNILIVLSKKVIYKNWTYLKF